PAAIVCTKKTTRGTHRLAPTFGGGCTSLRTRNACRWTWDRISFDAASITRAGHVGAGRSPVSSRTRRRSGGGAGVRGRIPRSRAARADPDLAPVASRHRRPRHLLRPALRAQPRHARRAGSDRHYYSGGPCLPAWLRGDGIFLRSRGPTPARVSRQFARPQPQAL